MPQPILCLITNRKAFGEGRLERVVEQAVAGGVNLVQLREKDLPDEELLAVAQRLRSITQGRALLTINSRPNVALEANANGVHFPDLSKDFSDDKANTDQNREIGRSLLVGCSVHDEPGVKWGMEIGADYVQAGHIFSTVSHPGESPAGLSLIRQIKRIASLPLVAVGGIDETKARDCIAAGADGIAVISAIGCATDPKAAAQRLWDALYAAYGSRG